MPARKHDLVTIEGEMASPVVEAPVAEAPPAPDVSWLDIATAPRDGTLVELHYTTHIPDKPIYARYRVTRRRIDRRIAWCINWHIIWHGFVPRRPHPPPRPRPVAPDPP